MLDTTKLPTIKQMAEAAYDFLLCAPYDQHLTYEAFSVVCGADAQELRTRSAILRAGRKLLKEHSKLLLNVRGIGYEIAKPEEHVVESQRQQRFASRKLRRALSSVTYVRFEGMDAMEINKVLAEQTRCVLKIGMDRKLSRAKALPKRSAVDIPSGRKIVAMLTAKRREATG